MQNANGLEWTGWEGRVNLSGRGYCGHSAPSSRLGNETQRQIEEMPMPILNHRKEEPSVTVSVPSEVAPGLGRESTGRNRRPRRCQSSRIRGTI